MFTPLFLSLFLFAPTLSIFVSNLFPISGLREGSQGQCVKGAGHLAGGAVCFSSAPLRLLFKWLFPPFIASLSFSTFQILLAQYGWPHSNLISSLQTQPTLCSQEHEIKLLLSCIQSAISQHPSFLIKDFQNQSEGVEEKKRSWAPLCFWKLVLWLQFLALRLFPYSTNSSSPAPHPSFPPPKSSWRTNNRWRVVCHWFFLCSGAAVLCQQMAWMLLDQNKWGERWEVRKKERRGKSITLVTPWQHGSARVQSMLIFCFFHSLSVWPLWYLLPPPWNKKTNQQSSFWLTRKMLL